MLEKKKCRGYIAARIALENSDEEMFDMLLPRTKYKELFQGAEDNVSVFEKAVSVNPSWIDKFDKLSIEPRFSILFSTLNISDLDNEEKFSSLWSEMCCCDPAFAHNLITKAIEKRHLKLSKKLVNAHLEEIKDQDLMGMTGAAVEYGNLPVLKLLLPRLRSTIHAVVVLAKVVTHNNLDMLDTLVKLDWPITKGDMYSLGRYEVNMSTVKALLDTGVFMTNVHFPKNEMSPRKFQVMAEAGFFIPSEKLYLLTLPEGEQFPTLRAFAVTAVREGLTNAQQKNLQFICKNKLDGWPNKIVSTIMQPGFSWKHVWVVWWCQRHFGMPNISH